jgi:hypothetical protein
MPPDGPALFPFQRLIGILKYRKFSRVNMSFSGGQSGWQAPRYWNWFVEKPKTG